ncbi:Calponin-1, partial [Lamprotornis superbus]
AVPHILPCPPHTVSPRVRDGVPHIFHATVSPWCCPTPLAVSPCPPDGVPVSPQLAQKYDPQHERELRAWIEGTTGRRIGDNFMDGLKDGVILCELINKLQPGSVPKVNEPVQNWHKVRGETPPKRKPGVWGGFGAGLGRGSDPKSGSESLWAQLENIGNFLRAITRYGVKPHDIFEANDLFENTNHTQVQSTLIALASQAKTKGNNVGGLGVKYAEKQQRRFHPEKLREGRNIIGLQVTPGDTWGHPGTRGGGGGMGTNKFASQQGMTAYGTRRHLYDPKLGTDQPLDQATISLQMGTNKGASQAGMTAPGTKRQIFEPALGMEHCDTMTIGLQMGSNKGASQQGMTVYGLPRQVYDPKYCGGPELLGHDGYDGHDGLYNSQ